MTLKAFEFWWPLYPSYNLKKNFKGHFGKMLKSTILYRRPFRKMLFWKWYSQWKSDDLLDFLFLFILATFIFEEVILQWPLKLLISEGHCIKMPFWKDVEVYNVYNTAPKPVLKNVKFWKWYDHSKYNEWMMIFWTFCFCFFWPHFSISQHYRALSLRLSLSWLPPFI